MRKMLSASTEPSCADMAMSQIKPFLYDSVNLRTAFNYSVSLRPGNLFEKFFGAEPGSYFTVQEKLEFKKHYISGALPGNLRVGFTVHFNELDGMLRDEEFLFSESLILSASEMQTMLAMPQEEKQKFYKNVMKVQLVCKGGFAFVWDPLNSRAAFASPNAFYRKISICFCCFMILAFFKYRTHSIKSPVFVEF